VPELEAIGVVKCYGGLVANDHVDLSVERGEIHGVMGENGAGKTTLMSILFGLQAPDAGEIRIRGAPVRFRSPLDAMAAGMGMVHQSFKLFAALKVWQNIVYGAEPKRWPLIDERLARVEICGVDVIHADVEAHRAAGLAYVPEDRASVGSALSASAADNLAMGFQRAPPLARWAFINPAAFTERARELIRRFAIRIPSERVNVGILSGGNLQKVVVARELSHEAPVLIAEQPTLGLDLGATQYLHRQLLAERDRGRAVLLVSAELSDILTLSDRVLVIFEGRILADLPQDKADEESVGLLMAGGCARYERRGATAVRRMSLRLRKADLPPGLRLPSVALAILFSAFAGGGLVLVSGHDPIKAYAEIGSLAPQNCRTR